MSESTQCTMGHPYLNRQRGWGGVVIGQMKVCLVSANLPLLLYILQCYISVFHP